MELPDSHLEVLQAIAGGHSDLEIDLDILDELRRWGMVMPGTLELTGMGPGRAENWAVVGPLGN